MQEPFELGREQLVIPLFGFDLNHYHVLFEENLYNKNLLSKKKTIKLA